MNWIIIIIILIVLAFVLLRMSHARHRMSLIIFILVLLFLYVTVSRVFTQYDINWKSISGLEKGVKVYFAWLGGAFNNVKVLTTNAIKMDWRMENKTDTAIKIIEKSEKK